ncbi:MAG TPA: hypothetical protein PLZ36_09100 [Armatimonadota bacterium]|nr:hypothetical protein [Armatimonadota bacterium]
MPATSPKSAGPIGTGRPTSLYLCHQVTPARWNVLHAYVVGVQRWLGVDLPVPAAIDGAKVAQIAAWLGERTPVKASLAILYLRGISGSMPRWPLSMLIGDGEQADATYEDYAAWYPPGSDDCSDDVTRYRQEVRQRSAPAGEIEELLHGIVREGQPGCMHRYTRHQDIKITSIGVLQWRGAVPAETDAPKRGAVHYFDQAEPAVHAWCRGEVRADAIGASLQTLLGAYAAWKSAIITDFFLAPKDDLNTVFYEWTTEGRGTR